MPSLVGGLGPGPPKMDPPGFFAEGGGGAKIEAPLHWQAPKVRGRSATGAEKGGIWEKGIPYPQQVFSTPQPTRGSGGAS